jgi:hypothetical protein
MRAHTPGWLPSQNGTLDGEVEPPLRHALPDDLRHPQPRPELLEHIDLPIGPGIDHTL